MNQLTNAYEAGVKARLNTPQNRAMQILYKEYKEQGIKWKQRAIKVFQNTDDAELWMLASKDERDELLRANMEDYDIDI